MFLPLVVTISPSFAFEFKETLYSKVNASGHWFFLPKGDFETSLVGPLQSFSLLSFNGDLSDFWGDFKRFRLVLSGKETIFPVVLKIIQIRSYMKRLPFNPATADGTRETSYCLLENVNC